MSISAAGDAERLHQPRGVAQRVARWWRSRASCRPGCSSRGSPRRSIVLRRDDQRLGRVQPAGDADDHLLDAACSRGASSGRAPGCCTPRSSARRARADRWARTGSARRRGAAAISPVGHAGTRSGRGGARAARSRWSPTASLKLVSRMRSCARRSRSMSAVMICSSSAKRSDFGQQVAVLVDQRVAVPGQVGGRFARPGGGVEVRRDALARTARRTGRWRYSALPMVMLLAERFASTVAPASAA